MASSDHWYVTITKSFVVFNPSEQEITHAFYHKGLYKLGSAYTNKKKRTFNDVKAESSRAKRSNMNLNVEKHADESSDSEEHSKTKRRKITHHTNNTPTNNLFVTKSRQCKLAS